MDPPRPPPVHVTPTTSNSEEDDLPLNIPSGNEQEQRDASPRRPARQPARRPAPPDLEEALTRLTQTVQAMVNHRPAPEPAAADAPADPAFRWDTLRSPLEVTVPLPSEGVVQRIAAGLFAKLQSGVLTGRDQHEARFTLDILADWTDMDQELRTRVFQRINIYAIVATHGWPTAIAVTLTTHNNSHCILPQGVTPVVQQRQQTQRSGGRRQNNNQAPVQAAAAPVPAPAPAPARGGRCGNRRQ